MIVRRLGLVEYEPTWRSMQRFTEARTADTPDEIWLCQHPPVFTLGQAGRAEHVLRDIGIPVVKIDRGGQVTYHGPGQWMGYLLIDLRRRDYKIREMVTRIEQAIIDLLAARGVKADRRQGAPGVYVGEAKIAALGLRVRNGCSYHGLAFNVDMDLAPFQAINPCGFAGLAVCQLRDFVPDCTMDDVGEALLDQLKKNLE